MDYIELRFSYQSTVPAEILNDVLAGELSDIGYEAFTEEAQSLLAYIRQDAFNKELLEQTLVNFPLTDVKFDYTTQTIAGKNWNEEWEKNYFKPVIIDDRCLIKASFHEVDQPYEYTILVDPKMAFGTGNHETTRLMLKELLVTDLTNTTVLDMGCGTAVLALLAEKRGAKEIVGIDIDESAYENALENIRRNQSTRIEVRAGGSEMIHAKESFDYIFANINRNILIQDMKVYADHLKSDGKLYLSGFYKSDIPAITEACEANSMEASEVNSDNQWALVRATKKK